MNLYRGGDNLPRDSVERRINKHVPKSAKKKPLELSVFFSRERFLCGIPAYLQAA